MRTIVMKRRAVALLGVGVLALSACAGAGEGGAPSGGGASDGGSDAGGDTAPASDRTEVGALSPRIVLAHDGGITTLDSADGSTLSSEDVEGYVRLNPAGDGRHVAVSASDTITMYDTGLLAQGHGDHFHYYVQDPALTDLSLDAPMPGHVVPHGDRTALFADGSGEITVIDPSALGEGDLGVLEETSTADPHHGVAVPLSDGGLLTTQGTEEARSTVQVLDADGNVTAETDDCPGVHGEAAAQSTESGDVISLGCENGPVIYRDGEFHKVAIEGDYQRSGNQKGHEDSPIVLADHKVQADPAGGAEHPTEIALIDTRDDTMSTVDLGSPYWFRSLDRGPDGEALVLTADGELNILDPDTGEMLHEVPVTGEWTEPENWQEPGPMLDVADGTAFVVDPAAQTLTMVDVASGEIYRELDLPVVPHEIQVTTGTASGEYEVAPGADDGAGAGDAASDDAASDGGGEHEDHEDHEDHEGHEHEGHDHGSGDGEHEGHEH
ncbi:outer membrane protein assembly factor BamB [Brachybacterium fresconis]|uniref:Outer membrane protein assembly factor BamB n=2 Tax=Brachybacterium fresconis TaxID=173363 RepID=A0ABS4YKR1_9MICO|nr:outer membrane protein assembly factor BamB [Brachybacterium fresconis]